MGTRRFYVDGSPAWGHTGSLRGYMAVTMYLPEQELTVVVMTNRGRISAVRIARQLAHAAIASLASAEKAA
jgi:CubicO group peptidase (beta-lactamase class C family)